jgi:hypothetical protein
MQQQPPSQHHSNTFIDVPCTTYFYREIPYIDETCRLPGYQVEALVTSTQTFYYSRGSLARNTLTKSDLAQIQIFDDLYLPEANALSIRLLFITAHNGAYLCAPVPRTGTLRILSHTPDPPEYDLATSAKLPITDTNWTLAQGATVYTWFHQYVETYTRGFYTHTGLTLMASKTAGLPLFLTANSLRDWLAEWGTETRNSKLFSHLNVRSLLNEYTLSRVIALAAWNEEAHKRYPGQTDRNAKGLVASYERGFRYPPNERDDVERPIPDNFTLG